MTRLLVFPALEAVGISFESQIPKSGFGYLP
jgi:hypothetical protein